MNTLVAVAIAPFGKGDNLSSEVAEVIKIIQDSGLAYNTTSMFTEIEGPWDEVMEVIKEATFKLANKGIRTEVVFKADIRPGYTDTINKKKEKVDNILKRENRSK